ncbi:MAG: type II secretion system ATPase GspE [Succinivibrionaceae bacterium]
MTDSTTEAEFDEYYDKENVSDILNVFEQNLNTLYNVKLPLSYARENNVVLIEQKEQLYLLCKNQPKLDILLEVRRFTHKDFTLIIENEKFDQLLVDVYQNDDSEARRIASNMGDDVEDLTEDLNKADLLDNSENSPMVRFINAMLAQAVKEEASDIHIEPYEDKLVIRFRVDGVLHENITLERKFTPYLISRIKVMSKLDISEKRIPQDGRISLTIGNQQVDVRVSTMPTSYSERIVMRLLDKNNVRLDLSQLGMTQSICNNLIKLVHSPHGILLVTGPTGSGKSTTLYAAISEINTKDRNILTVEDPVEYDLEGIGQTQVNTKVDMTFARALRAILRQDPDIVMIGEIRDRETAEIAVQASLTGHLVLSTLHTNTAIGAITRLNDMGIEPFLLSTSLIGVLSQRLVRTLCPKCKEKIVTNPMQMKLLGILKPCYIYKPCGCSYCNNSGYKGRTGIHELIIINEEIRQAISRGISEIEIEKIARNDVPSIKADGLSKVLEGVTSLEEVLRVTSGE